MTMIWRKSSYCGDASWTGEGGDDCVEVAGLPGLMAIRDSKAGDGSPVLRTGSSWLAALRAS